MASFKINWLDKQGETFDTSLIDQSDLKNAIKEAWYRINNGQSKTARAAYGFFITEEVIMHRTEVCFTVLSEKPIPGHMDLAKIIHECDEGDCVGDWNSVTIESKEITGKQMADALYAAGSDPGFFQLDDEGKNIND